MLCTRNATTESPIGIVGSRTSNVFDPFKMPFLLRLLPLCFLLLRILGFDLRHLLFCLNLLLHSLLFLLLRLGSLPVFAAITVRPPQYPARAWDVEKHERNEHRYGVKDVCVPLVHGNAAEHAGRELDQAVDVPEDDEAEDRVEEVEKVASVDWRVEVFHVDALTGDEAGLFLSSDLELEAYA